MSKSRGTQVAPDELVKIHGADPLRLHLMFLGPWDQGGPWNNRGIVGMERFIRRSFAVVAETVNAAEGTASDAERDAVRRLTHRTIERVTRDLEDFQFNTMVAALIEFTNELTRLKETAVVGTAEWIDAVESLVLLMAPSTPFVAEELWERLGKPYSVHLQDWPEFDADVFRENEYELVVQINGKVRDRVSVAVGADEATATAAAMEIDRIAEQFAGRQLLKAIFVPGRLINFVVR